MPWRLADHPESAEGPTVLTTFSCGGGSSMGYRLAGCRVVGAVEVDPQMAAVYGANLGHAPHQVKVQDFRSGEAADGYAGVDILDGSPPCTLFTQTRTGGRKASEKLWAKDVKLREGGVEQRVNDLFFEFVALAKRIQPKVVIAENVRGMVMGRARGYAKQVLAALRRAGYRPQVFLLDSSHMGVPQRRQRVFFVASRRDLKLPRLKLRFDESPIRALDAIAGASADGASYPKAGSAVRRMWLSTKPGKQFGAANGVEKLFNWWSVDPLAPCPTVTTFPTLLHWTECRTLSAAEVARLQSFPDDYDFGEADPQYVMGMSVPPLMVERLAREVRRQWL